MKKHKPIKYTDDFVFDDTKTEYVFKMKKRSHLWLWLLFTTLFIALCFVKCERDMVVKVVDNASLSPVTPTLVTIDYTAHYLFNDGRFFDSESYTETQETDENGEVVFEDLPCSIFSYIFYAFSDAHLTIGNGCNYLPDSPATCLFHYTWETYVKLDPKTEDVFVVVTDSETNEPLAGAVVLYNYTLSRKTITDSIKTNAAGKSLISGVPRCGTVQLEKVSCYGYVDTTHIELNVLDVLTDPSSSIVPLTPLKESFTYYVKNKFTKQPIPEAIVDVILTSGNGSVTRGQSTTNVDGQGRGTYHDAFILADLALKATKNHYKPGQFEKRCTVKDFAELPDSSKVIYLEPEPYMREFKNVDSISGQPIVGVENNIKVYCQDGREEKYREPSNRYGIFQVIAMEGDRIIIDSKCDPQYKPKHTEIESFEEEVVIPMCPNKINLVFRTLEGGTQNLLPKCNLMIVDEDGNSYAPDDSGNGEFVVENLPANAILSIIAQKDGFEPNSTSVDHVEVNYLMSAPQSRRDIPLDPEILPCDGGIEIDHADVGDIYQRTFGLGRMSGTTTISIDFDAASDYITVYDGPNTSYPVIIPKSSYKNKHTIPIRFNNGCITVVMEGSSLWKYTVNCPD